MKSGKFLLSGVLISLLTACGENPTPPAQQVQTVTVEVTRVVEVTRIADRIITATPAPTTAAPTATPTLAATAKPTTVAATTPGKVGDAISKGGYILTVNKVERSKGFNQFSTPKAGNTFILVDVTIQSDSEKGVTVNPYYLKIKDSEGFTYPNAYSGKEPQLALQENLVKGTKLRGWVSFDVPESAKGLVLEFIPIVFGSNIIISVSLD